MKTVISIKIDEDVKVAAQAIAKSTGLTLSGLVNAYLRQVCVTRRIELFAPEEMTGQLESQVVTFEKELQEGEISKTYTTVESVISALEA